MGFQDATSGGAQGFQSPWMTPKGGPGGVEEVPLDAKLGKSQPNLASWNIAGSTTSQGGGSIVGGGIGGGPILVSGDWGSERGFIGGPGWRTGGGVS